MSGSGVIIDPKGIILTNAHIAQYFLLADRGVSCTIRSGSPAVNRYEANLVYISPAWLRANANVLTQTNPSGTGEYDFAFLAITKSKTPEALPSSFPFVPLATVPPASGTPVVIASYGAQFLESSQIQSSLFPTIVFGSVKDVFTFVSTTIDILALGGSAARPRRRRVPRAAALPVSTASSLALSPQARLKGQQIHVRLVPSPLLIFEPRMRTKQDKRLIFFFPNH